MARVFLGPSTAHPEGFVLAAGEAAGIGCRVRILDRLVLTETAGATALATGGCVFILTAGNLVRQVAGEMAAGRIDGFQALELLVLILPSVLPHALPLGVLAGILIAFGRMGAQSEVTAMRAGGVPLWRIASPVLAMAAVLAAGAAYINLELAPAANTAYRGILRGAVTDNPAAAIIPGELCRNFPGVVIRASTREAGTLGDLWVWQVAEDGQLTQSLHARSAVTLLVPGEDGGPDRLRISARDVRVEQRRPGDSARLQTSTYASMERAELDFPLRRTAGSGQRKLRWLTTAELIEAMDKGWQLPATATAEQLDASRLQARRQLNAHLGGALGIFSLAVLAVPLSLRVGRRETFVNAAVALGVALTYYALTSAAEWVTAPGLRPDLLAWAPSLCVLALGLVLLRRADRV